MKILPPIFIIGEARSGKSLLGNFLAVHKDTCWFSNYTDRFPQLPQMAFLNRLIDLPIVGPKIKHSIVSLRQTKFLPRPVEGQNIYHSYCQLERFRYVTEQDLTPYQLSRFRKIIEDHIRFLGKPRFLSDQSANNQRIRQIAKICPNAYFIHVIRDGRAVANEVLRTKWWLDRHIWWFGNNPRVWNESGKEPVLLCGLNWKHNLTTIFENANLFRDRYLEVRYEDLTSDTTGVVRKVAEFCRLKLDDDLERYIPMTVKSENYRWRKELTSKQIEALNQELYDFLFSLGYK